MKSYFTLFSVFLFSVFSLTQAFAGGQAEKPPVIQMQDQPRQFIAPGNPDATAKSLALPFSTITLTTKGQVIKSWTFDVFDSSGKKVFEDSRLETRDRGFFGELFNIGDRPQVEIPKELTWDGTYKIQGSPQDGKLVPDGNYTYQITIADNSGKLAQTPPFNVTVKNARITVDYIRAPHTIFSPVGQRSTLAFEQSGSREFHWEGFFQDSSGKVVRTLDWENSTDNQFNDLTPPAFAWDGKDDQGAPLPEGSYLYTLRGRNRSGAVYEQKFPQPLVISTKAGLLKLTSDLTAFSPLADGTQNSLHLTPDSGDSVGLASWTLSVAEAGHPSVALWSRGGKKPLPSEIIFDGKDSFGRSLPEGHYQAVLNAVYDNGDTSASPPLPFLLDLTPPRGELSASALVFGGSGRAGVTVTLKSEPGVSWDVDVLDRQGKSVRQYPMGDTGEASFDFQGLDEKGNPFPDGPYTVKASAHSSTGILGTKILQLQKDSRSMKASLDLSRGVLVPGKVQQGVVRITPVLEVVDSIEKTSLSIVDASGKPVINKDSDGIITFWDWNGQTPAGMVANGHYQAAVEVTYANGTVAKSQKDLVVDSNFLNDQSPQVDMSLSTKTFVPGNIDGPQNLTVNITTTEGVNPVDTWQLSVLDPRGKPFRQFSGKGIPPSKVVWDGKSDKGESVESGEDYQIVLKVADTQKRETRKQDSVTIDILVVKIGPDKYKIVVSSIQFAGYSSDVFKVDQPLLMKNQFVLRRLALALNKFPGYKIRLEGYAVSEFWNDAKLADQEQKNVLLPLSLDRAEEVRDALVLLGVDNERFAVKGFGSERPLVPNSDLENRWKNRRVEFYLDKP